MEIAYHMTDIQSSPGRFLRDYRILSELKSGSSSKVFLALYYKNLWFKKCAIRQVSMMSKKEYKRQLNAYSNHLTLCSILPIATVVEYFEQGSDSFLVLNYLQGHNLQEELDKESKGDFLKPPSRMRKLQLVMYLIEVCTIIETLHANGYVHRDISGSNFIVDRRGKVSLIDLELCIVASETNSFFHSWTDGYSSPQQVKGERPDRSDDIFSFGCLMLNVLSKHHPKKLRRNMLHSEIETLLRDHWSTDLRQLLNKCIDLNPKARPTAKDILITLKACSEAIAKSS